MQRYYYASTIPDFLQEDETSILGKLAAANEFALLKTQRDAWVQQISILKENLKELKGHVCLEYTIPRMGRRIDAVLIVGPVLYIIEFKIGASEVNRSDLDQVWDYALDLKNFHEPSHNSYLVPILIPSNFEAAEHSYTPTLNGENLFNPVACPPIALRSLINQVHQTAKGHVIIANEWLSGRYSPTPTIVEAARALYRGHSVTEISRSDSSATSLETTSNAISKIIDESRTKQRKSICFLTGVPGAGKTLVGLNIATQHMESVGDTYSVFLSGNGPLVAILREALARDKKAQQKEMGNAITKGSALREVKTFIQNVHHFRDECLQDLSAAPREHVTLFDEAQRAWNLQQTSAFMSQKKKGPEFQSI